MSLLGPLASGSLAIALICRLVAPADADQAAPFCWQLDTPPVCQVPSCPSFELRERPLLQVEATSALSDGEQCRAAPDSLKRCGLMLMRGLDDDLAAGPDLMPTIPRWSDQVAVAVPPAIADVEAIDFAAFARQTRASFLDWRPTEARESDFDRCFRYEAPRSWEPTLSAGLPRETWVAGGTLTIEPWLTVMRRRPIAPSGTMYLWSFETSASAATESHGAGERGGPSTSAGFVLTRPPGDYSVDWVGVAVTAPIR